MSGLGDLSQRSERNRADQGVEQQRLFLSHSARLAGGGKPGQDRQERGQRAGRVELRARGRDEIDAKRAFFDRTSPRQLDAAKPAIGELGDSLSGIVEDYDIGRYRSNPDPGQP
jgi:hypothetical protein